MIFPENPYNEAERLRALKSYGILDSFSEKEYDQLTIIASQICGCSMSLISLIDENRQWFKSKVGLDVIETERKMAFCAHAINDPSHTLVVPDASLDERFFDNPLVTGDPHLSFYAGVPLVNQEGMALGTLCVLDSEPKTLSEAQLNALSALADQVMVLLELRKSKFELEGMLKKLEDKNKELEHFAFIAAHDLKSPLNGISSLTDLLLDSSDGKLSEVNTRMIKAIQSSSHQLSSMIGGLLDYYRLDRELSEVKTPITGEELIHQIQNLFGNEKDVELLFSIVPNVINTHGQALLQVLLNLVSNSIKYGDKPVTTVQISIEEQEGCYRATVSDNGPGIDCRFHDKLFGLFETATPADRFGRKGNGIGLATVKKLVERAGGTIHIQTEPPSMGTTFVFTLAM
jgi:signal transduction histidine kinase